jgi:hypothetical protein
MHHLHHDRCFRLHGPLASFAKLSMPPPRSRSPPQRRCFFGRCPRISDANFPLNEIRAYGVFSKKQPLGSPADQLFPPSLIIQSPGPPRRRLNNDPQIPY